MKKYYAYVRIYGATRSPKLLHKYVPKHLLAREITYHSMEKVAISYLSEKKKRYWLNFPIHIGSYSLQKKKKDKKEL
jgi:hypothetical protein